MKKKIIRKIPKNKFVKKYKKIAKEAIKMAKKEIEKEETSKEESENVINKSGTPEIKTE